MKNRRLLLRVGIFLAGLGNSAKKHTPIHPCLHPKKTPKVFSFNQSEFFCYVSIGLAKSSVISQYKRINARIAPLFPCQAFGAWKALHIRVLLKAAAQTYAFGIGFPRSDTTIEDLL